MNNLFNFAVRNTPARIRGKLNELWMKWQGRDFLLRAIFSCPALNMFFNFCVLIVEKQQFTVLEVNDCLG